MKLQILATMVMVGYGCATKKLVAQNADYLLERQIMKRLPLYSEQRTVLSRDLKRFLTGQKQFVKEAIPMVSEIQGDVSKVETRYDYLKALYQKLALNFSELISKHLTELDAKQQKDFFTTLEDENRKLASKTLEDQIEVIEERFELLFGTITAKQQRIFEEYGAYLKERKDLHLKHRKALTYRLQDIYPMDLSRAARTEYFIEAFKDYQKNYADGTRNLDIIKRILPTLLPEQKKTFQHKTEELKDILNYYLEADY